jgi:hypothetical protein
MWNPENTGLKLHPLSADNRILLGYDPRTPYDYEKAKLEDVPALLRTLLHKLARRRPDWKFVVSKFNEYGGPSLTHLSVLQDSEVVGTCWSTSFGSTSAIAVENTRIAQDFPRRGHQVTSKVEVATRIVTNYFTPMTDGERLHALASKHASHASSVLNETVNKLTRAYNFTVAPKMLPLLLARLEEFTPELAAAGVSEDILKALPSLSANNDTANQLLDNRAMVTFSNDHYFITSMLKLAPRINRYKVPQSAMPAEWREKIGILKLVPVGQVIVGVGVSSTAGFYALAVTADSFTTLASYAVA